MAESRGCDQMRKGVRALRKGKGEEDGWYDGVNDVRQRVWRLWIATTVPRTMDLNGNRYRAMKWPRQPWQQQQPPVQNRLQTCAPFFAAALFCSTARQPPCHRCLRNKGACRRACALRQHWGTPKRSAHTLWNA